MEKTLHFLLIFVSFEKMSLSALLPLQRTPREVYPEVIDDVDASTDVCILGDVVYTAGDVVPADQPCLKCKCQPPGVHCETIKCAKKTNCKSIQGSNKCCPEYQCECQHEGVVYANGEKVNATEENCKVCYCRSGEIQCAQVSCYFREDCEAKYVEGQCCPKYDHCPLKENVNATETTTQESVFKIGDKILILREGELVPENISTEVPVITIVGAEGLQRGYESLENEENSTNSLEPEASESSHIFSLVKRPITSTTEMLIDDTISNNVTESEVENVTDINLARSIESIESEEESGENTTPKDRYVDSTSVETENNSELSDMTKNPEVETEETIKKIQKRQNLEDAQREQIFKELEAELTSTESTRTQSEEKEESEKIFGELLRETSGSYAIKEDVKGVQQITDAVAKIVFGGRKGGNSNILGTLSSLLNLQHRFGG